ncbi:MAG: hypothetical protein ACXAC2_03705 [Candidatus Kariarchaeaceae archaeon]|jgi:hypothetical protein
MGLSEISYQTYCNYGALSNPQLTKKDLYSRMSGKFIKTRYYSILGTGVLCHPSTGIVPSPKGK